MATRLVSLILSFNTALILGGCGQTKPCRPGTVLLSFELPAAVTLPANLIFDVLLDGTHKSAAFTARQRQGTVEVDFPAGYPVGRSVTFSVKQQGGTDQILAKTETLPAECAPVTLVAAESPDLSGGADMAGIPDMIGIPDMASLDQGGDMTLPCQGITVSTLTGSGISGFIDGTGGPSGTTEFNNPAGIAADATYVYVADYGNSRIRRIASDGTTTTLAGNGTQGFLDGTGGAAGTTKFFYPTAISVDGSGNVFVADQANSRIRKVAANGTTTTLAGGALGYFDGTGGPSGTTQFKYPTGTAIDANGIVYVSEGNWRIRKVATDGTTTTLSGNGTKGYVDGTGGAAGTSEFNYPGAIAVDANGVLFLPDDNLVIRRVAADGTTTTLAGNGTSGHVDGTGSKTGTTQFTDPKGIAIDGAGNLYVGDTTWVRKISPDGTTTTIAGTATAGFLDGNACQAQFRQVIGVAINGKTLFVTDTADQRIRKLQLP